MVHMRASMTADAPTQRKEHEQHLLHVGRCAKVPFSRYVGTVWSPLLFMPMQASSFVLRYCYLPTYNDIQEYFCLGVTLNSSRVCHQVNHNSVYSSCHHLHLHVSSWAAPETWGAQWFQARGVVSTGLDSHALSISSNRRLSASAFAASRSCTFTACVLTS
eukprot:3941840-Amphidinium_carterae.1